MNDYIITTDTTADLPEQLIKDHNIGILSLSYILEGKTYHYGNDLPYNEFYKKMRNGSMPTTSQINPEEAKEAFTKYLDQGKDILHIAFSSGLSGSCNNAGMAARELMEERDCRIKVVDSLCASLGEGLLVYKAVKLKEQGKTLEEVEEWLHQHALNLVHVFTVDDLFHLYRGGRVSKTAAVLGTMINVKPILHVDNEGHLIPIGKVRGRKKSLISLVDYMDKKIGSYRNENDIIFISHGDSLEDAEYVADLVKERLGIKNVLINHIGPTVGAHSGPGTIALFFLGDER